jgi:sterol 24-C-methyltransferase
MRLADRLDIKEGSKVLDVGYACSVVVYIELLNAYLCSCGIGGPLINIAKNTGAHITGLNNNAYQVSRANSLLKENGIKNCNFVKGFFFFFCFLDLD